MTDLTFDSPDVRDIAIPGRSTESTPMHRAARQLQDALPPGWEVDVVDAPRRPGQIAAAMLRVQKSDRR
jgi:hypothetical protein